MSKGNYTFYPQFTEVIPLYRGVIRVWIGKGEDGKNYDRAGFLYAEYIDGAKQELGFVSDYEQAKDVIHDELGIDLSYEQWIKILYYTPENALDAEAFAAGTRAGQDVVEGDDAYHNNAKHYSEVSKDQADRSYSEAQRSLTQANRAAMWAVGNSTGNGDINNNAKYWAEQSKEFTNGTDLDDHAVTARETDNAQYYSDLARRWANNRSYGNEPSATNNAYYWADNARTAFGDAQLAKENAEASAINAAKASNHARTSETNAGNSADLAQKWAVGTPASWGYPQYETWEEYVEHTYEEAVEGALPTDTNNAMYWAKQSKEHRDAAEVAETAAREANVNATTAQAGAEQAQHIAENLYDGTVANKLQAEAWAKGTKNGDPDPERATDNSKYYSERSSASEQNAAASASHAAASESNAEAWAVGTRNGVPVEHEDETWNNNSRSYAISSANSMIASTESKNRSEAWARGTIENIPVGSDDASYHNNSKYYSEQSASSAQVASQSASNALNSASSAAEDLAGVQQIKSDVEQIKQDTQANAEAATENKLQSEAWANGTRNNIAVPNSNPAYRKNSKYFSEQAKLWANYGVEGNSPTPSNNARAWAIRSSESASTAISKAEEVLENTESAKASKNDASLSRTEAQNSADLAQKWAVGTPASWGVQGYDKWSDYINDQITYGELVEGAIPTDTNNAMYWAKQAEISKTDVEAWAVGKRNGIPVPSTDQTYHNNSQYYATKALTAITSAAKIIADEYNPAATYSIGDYCLLSTTEYGCLLYRCKTNIGTPEPFTSSHWIQENVIDAINNSEPIILDLGPYTYDTSTGGSYEKTLCYSVFPDAEAIVSARSDLPSGAFIFIRAQIWSTGTTGMSTGRGIMACRSENATSVRWDFCVLRGASMINGWWSDQTWGTSSPVIRTSKPLSEDDFFMAVQRNISSEYSSSATYEVGDYCVRSDSYYGFQMYRCNTAISTPEQWTAAHWTQITVPSMVDEKASKEMIANIYDSTSTYMIGDYCLYTNASNETSLYRCKNTINTPEAFTAWHWTKLSIVNAIDEKDPIVLNLPGPYEYGSDQGPTYESIISNIFQDAETIIYDRGYTAPKFIVINANVVDTDLSTVSDGRFITACRTRAATYVKWDFTIMFNGTVIYGTWTNDTPMLDSPWIQIYHTLSEEKHKKMMKTIADEYDVTSSYSVGDYCLVFGGSDECALYRCKTAIAAGGETWNSAHWTKVTLTDILKQLS